MKFNPFFKTLVLGLIFGICYVQEPLYTSNQNTKFLQGAAQAGLGYLNQDWLANTLDPLPVFTAIVQFTFTYLHPTFFHLYYLILFGVYVYSLMGISEMIFKLDTKTKQILYFALLVLIHSLGIVIFDFKVHVHLHYGVAKQYILGDYFQTSNFGVFLLLSIYLFLKQKPYLSIISLAVAATVHPTYLPSAALLTLVYLVILYKKGENLKDIFLIGWLSFLLVLPVTLYTAILFQPTSSALTIQAKNLLTSRIPHHSFTELWLDEVAGVQILVIAIAIYLVRKTDLGLILGLPFLVLVGSTFLQLLLKNDFLGFLTPWRVSAFLVPLSTAMILAAMISFVFEQFPQFCKTQQKKINFVSLMILASFLTYGVFEQIDELKTTRSYFPLMEYVKQTKQPNDLYLVPHTSGNFWQFRLRTGAPILINYKSHPYKDTEVIEWHNRLMMAQRFYSPDFQETRCQTLTEIVETYQITHVITELGEKMPCQGWEAVYTDEQYTLYQPLSSPNSIQNL